MSTLSFKEKNYNSDECFTEKARIILKKIAKSSIKQNYLVNPLYELKSNSFFNSKKQSNALSLKNAKNIHLVITPFKNEELGGYKKRLSVIYSAEKAQTKYNYWKHLIRENKEKLGYNKSLISNGIQYDFSRNTQTNWEKSKLHKKSKSYFDKQRKQGNNKSEVLDNLIASGKSMYKVWVNAKK